jgi:hypothetical protein
MVNMREYDPQPRVVVVVVVIIAATPGDEVNVEDGICINWSAILFYGAEVKTDFFNSKKIKMQPAYFLFF